MCGFSLPAELTGVHNYNLRQSPRPHTIGASRPQPNTSIQVSQGQAKRPRLGDTSVSLAAPTPPELRNTWKLHTEPRRIALGRYRSKCTRKNTKYPPSQARHLQFGGDRMPGFSPPAVLATGPKRARVEAGSMPANPQATRLTTSYAPRANPRPESEPTAKRQKRDVTSLTLSHCNFSLTWHDYRPHIDGRMAGDSKATGNPRDSSALGTPEDYNCLYCGIHRTSASACCDGRVRIRCDCGGVRQDNIPRFHPHSGLGTHPQRAPVHTGACDLA